MFFMVLGVHFSMICPSFLNLFRTLFFGLFFHWFWEQFWLLFSTFWRSLSALFRRWFYMFFSMQTFVDFCRKSIDRLESQRLLFSTFYRLRIWHWFWSHFGAISAPFWRHFSIDFGLILDRFWSHVGFILASCWLHFKAFLPHIFGLFLTLLFYIRCYFGSILASCWLHFKQFLQHIFGLFLTFLFYILYFKALSNFLPPCKRLERRKQLERPWKDLWIVGGWVGGWSSSN